MSVVFFDLDGTIVKGQSQMLLLLYLAKRGAISKLLFVKICLRVLVYKAGIARDPGATMAYAYHYIASGLSAERMGAIVSDFYDRVLRWRLSAVVLTRLRRHLDYKDEVVLLTNVFEPLAEMVAKELGIRRVMATKLEMVNGVYTGRIEGKIMYGDNKADVLRRHYNEEQLRGGFAYADHPSDGALLRMVGTAFLVNAKKGRIDPYGG